MPTTAIMLAFFTEEICNIIVMTHAHFFPGKLNFIKLL